MRCLLLALALLFSACGVKNYEFSEPKIIIVKSPKLKFADLGYVRHTDDAIELELFVAGKMVKKITINHLICVDEGCMGKTAFNAEYLNASYPESLLQNVILGRKIYDGENTLKTGSGFSQSVRTRDAEIEYAVSANAISFKDRKNKIIIQIKDTNQ
jgi:hypothetical protein